MMIIVLVVIQLNFLLALILVVIQLNLKTLVDEINKLSTPSFWQEKINSKRCCEIQIKDKK